MPIKLYDTKDAVPEAQREAALETKDGKFAVEEVDPALGEAGRKALEKERERANDEEKKRKALEKERDELKRAADARAGNISDEQLEKLRQEDADKRKAEIEPIVADRDRLTAENRKLKLTDRVRVLALGSGVMPDRIEDAMLALDKRTDLTESGDGIVVKDKDGKVTTEKIDDFLKKTFKAEKPWLYAGSGGAGSGTRGSNGGGSDEPTPESKEREAERRQAIAGSF